MYTTLVILPCHSIWKGGNSLGESRDEWHLVNFQIEGYDHLAFKDHIIQSIEYIKSDPHSFLILSGGQTKAESGPISESLSYYQLATQLVEDEHKSSILSRISTEEYARDSFENVIFSICRFYELFNKYPDKITIIGFEFKRDRFLKYHLYEALNFPLHRVKYIGNSPTPKDLSDIEKQIYFKDLDDSEYKFAVKFFQEDWYGIRKPLASKKASRNPFKRWHGYAHSNPSLSKFLLLLQQEVELDNEDIRKLLIDAPWISTTL
ncbi:uncharacterized protein RJT21DRAFT_122441 [Scheffersomyces amazonensis]|uniref:uncharacterized protein n=1 Tax=Scheffersomyces amazonensis TaxID=1078765 RepID=UPI00315C67C4